MKSYLSLIFRYIKRDNKAYFFSFISIIIASFLLTITWGTYKIKTNTHREKVNNELGNYTGYFNNISFEQSNILKNHNNIKEVGLAKNKGYVKTDILNNREDNVYLNIMALDNKSFENIFNINITEGRLPQNSSEVLINYNINYLLKNSFSIGDEIELEVKGDVNAEGKKKKYTVVGVIDDLTPQAKEFKAIYNQSSFEAGEFLITYLDEDEMHDGTYRAYVKIDDKNLIPQICSNTKLYVYSNEKLNELEDYFTKKGFIYKSKSLIGIDNNIYFVGNTQMIMYTVIIVAFIISISAFGISFQCKASDMDELIVIGAYRKQIRAIILLETIMISAVATIGATIISCLILCKIGTLKYLKDYIIIALNSSIIIIVVNILAVFKVIKVYGEEEEPSKLGANDIDLNNFKLKKSRNIVLLLAKRYSKYYDKKNKYINYSITIMFVVIMILFNQFSMFKNNVNGITKNTWQAEYSRTINSIGDSEVEEIKSINGVKEVYGESEELDIIAPINKDKYIKVDLENKLDINIPEEIATGVKPIKVKVKIIGENELDVYKERLNTGTLDKESFKKGGLILDISSITDTDYSKIQKENTIDIYGNEAFKIGEDIKLPIKNLNINKKNDTTDQIGNYIYAMENGTTNFIELPVMALINNTVTVQQRTPSVGNLTVLMSKDYAKTIFLQEMGYGKLYINFTTDNSLEAEEKLKSYSKLKGDSFYSYKNYIEKKNILVNEELKFYLGINIMLLTIVILNIINTVRVNVLTRKNDIYLLQAIGMSKNQVKKTLILENIWLILKACIIGSLISLGLTAISQFTIAVRGTNLLHLWITSLLLTIAFVFINSFIGAYIAIRKI